MLQMVARLAISAPRRVALGALCITIAAAIFGAPVTSSLSNGGFRDPASESARASAMLAEKFGLGDAQVVVAVTARDGVYGVAARAAGADIVARLTRLPYVAHVQSAWTAPPQAVNALVGDDGRTALVVAGLTGGESAAQQHARDIAGLLPEYHGVTIRFGGEAMTNVAIIDQTKKDLRVMEFLAVPLSFAILVWVFGGLLAAALPLAVGVIAVVGSLAVIRVIALRVEVSIFALNLILAMGLALAIDYTLLIVSRYRGELAGGAAPDEALTRTMATAGRTVLLSAVTVALSMIAMVFFPMYFLQSFAYAGVAVVAFAVVAAIVVTPAAIVLLGDRLDSMDVRRLGRRLTGRPAPPDHAVEQMFWYRWTKVVMRQAIPIGLAVTALMLALGAPFLGIRWGHPDDRVLPTSASVRRLGDELRTQFAVNAMTDVTVVAPALAGVAPAELDRYARELSRVPDVTSVAAPAGVFVDGVRVGTAVAPAHLGGDGAVLTVHSRAPLYSAASDDQLDRLHAIAPPGGHPVLFTGFAQVNRDDAAAIGARLPTVLAVVAVVTFALMFLVTGSVVLPVKTLLLNVLSLTAAFGALVWIFQDGHLGGLGTTTTGTLVASVPVLLFCLAFGLSMDYEVFLVSRIREFWLASGRTRADNDESVALGLAHTGRVVTAAALLMAVTFASLTAAQVSIMRMFGVGVPLAVLMDATLVRMLLVPAFMRVLGSWNWWAPRPARWLHGRTGVGEGPGVVRPAADAALAGEAAH